VTEVRVAGTTVSVRFDVFVLVKVVGTVLAPLIDGK
jgi:hypothetical protein